MREALLSQARALVGTGGCGRILGWVPGRCHGFSRAGVGRAARRLSSAPAAAQRDAPVPPEASWPSTPRGLPAAPVPECHRGRGIYVSVTRPLQCACRCNGSECPCVAKGQQQKQVWLVE